MQEGFLPTGHKTSSKGESFWGMEKPSALSKSSPNQRLGMLAFAKKIHPILFVRQSNHRRASKKYTAQSRLLCQK